MFCSCSLRDAKSPGTYSPLQRFHPLLSSFRHLSRSTLLLVRTGPSARACPQVLQLETDTSLRVHGSSAIHRSQRSHKTVTKIEHIRLVYIAVSMPEALIVLRERLLHET